MSRLFLLICGICFIAGCGSQPIASTERHINSTNSTPTVPENIPQPVRAIPLPPPPKPQAKVDRYSVVVNNVPVQELLFALARDAKVNVDIHPGIEGRVSLNAIDQTLPQILNRLAKQTDLRFELDGQNLVVMPDSPYLKTYKIDYVNISRTSTGNVGISTQIATTGSTSVGNATASSTSNSDNGSTSKVTNNSENKFWERLIQNVKDLLKETDKIFPEGSSEKQITNVGKNRQVLTSQSFQLKSKQQKTGNKSNAIDEAKIKQPGEEIGEDNSVSVERNFTFSEAASVIANPESGVISVRATSRQHEKVQDFLDKVIGSAKRQVLIEATIVEVTLSDQYKAGVDWGAVFNVGGKDLQISQSFNSGNFITPAPLFRIFYPGSVGGAENAIQLLSAFGDAKVLSSPKIMALNNQTALLKVVDENVYFTIEVKETDAIPNVSAGKTTITSNVHTVPVGVVMSVTPQIGDNNEISINVRPTVSRISSYILDPTPALRGFPNVPNRIPQIQVREFESILRVPNGQTVILGGLMQDEEVKNKNGVPGLSDAPAIGNAFKYHDETSKKTELIIFLRPTVINDTTSFASTLENYRGLLPDKNFFNPEQKSNPQGAQGKNP